MQSIERYKAWLVDDGEEAAAVMVSRSHSWLETTGVSLAKEEEET